MKTFNYFFLVLVALVLFVSNAYGDETKQVETNAKEVQVVGPVKEEAGRELVKYDRNSIFRLLRRNANLRMLKVFVKDADLQDALGKGGPYTLLAPTNKAFRNIKNPVVKALKKDFNTDLLRQVLLYHVLPFEATSSTIVSAVKSGTWKFDTLLPGAQIRVQVENNEISILSAAAEEAVVIDKDIDASNGVIHKIDQVLVPASFPPTTLAEIAESVSELSELVNALVKTNLVDLAVDLTHRGVTVFAPNDQAFKNLAKALGLPVPYGTFATDVIAEALGQRAFKKVLKYHVARTFEDSEDLITKAKVDCSDHLFKNLCTKQSRLETNIALQRLEPALVNDELVIRFGKDFTKYARIVGADNRALIGVAHVIDTVMIPN